MINLEERINTKIVNFLLGLREDGIIIIKNTDDLVVFKDEDFAEAEFAKTELATLAYHIFNEEKRVDISRPPI